MKLVRYIHLNPIRARGFTLDKLADRVAEVLGVKQEDAYAAGKH